MTTPTSIDKYQIIKPLGSGHFGQVFHAFDRALMAEKAIKVLNVTDPSKFLEHLEEAQILSACRHKHIVTINEANIFEVDGNNRVVLDLEFIPEGSLESAMASRWISVREAIGYIRGALSGLEHAHSQGVLHRDIKPGNILLAANAPKLSDFGLATTVNPGQSGSAKGYITHVAPEYISTGKTSQQTDVFAMGITLFRAASNINDWRAVTNAIPKKMEHIKKGTLIRKIGHPEFVPTSLRRIINKACAADPNKRYSTASEFGQSLDALRFGIDWVMEGDLEWKGNDGKHAYDAGVNPNTFEMIVKKGERRNNSLCKKFKNLNAAVAALYVHLSTTTLA